MIAPVDQGGSPLKLVHEKTEEMWLIGVIETFNTSFGDYAATVRLFEIPFVLVRTRPVATESLKGVIMTDSHN